MKYLAPAALALMLGACAHECNCAGLEPMAAETVEAIEMEVEEPVVEEIVAEEVVEEVMVEEPAPVLTIESAPVVETETTPGRRVVTRRIVEQHDAGTPTAPAMAGSAADDELLSETPRVLEDTTMETTTTTIVETVEDNAEDLVEDAVDAVDGE